MKTSFNGFTGKTLTLQKDVKESDSYEGLLSTAALTKLMLDTAWKLLEDQMPEGFTSVATMVHVTHEEPTVAGETVTVAATIKEVEERRISIELRAVDETGVIAHGLNERLIVNKISLKKLADNRAAVLKTIL